MKAVAEGQQVHAHMIKNGDNPDIFLATTLINMYAKCHSMLDAWQVFDNLPVRNVASWTAIIAGYTQQGHGEEALRLFWQMQEEGERPDEVIFTSILKACASIGVSVQGKAIHAHLLRSGINQSVFIENTLVHMYGKCGTLEDARQLFDRMSKRDLVSWNTMISAYTQHGLAHEAFRLSQDMDLQGIAPDDVTIVNMVKVCASLENMEEGRHVHLYIIENEIKPNKFLSNALLDMYCKCGSINDALNVFKNMPDQNVVSWTAMIAGYAKHNNVEEALNLYWQMEGMSMKPNKVTFVSILGACTTFTALEGGKRIHACIIRSGYEFTFSVSSAIVNMYVKCGNIEDAYQVFTKMLKQNVISWTTMITGCAKYGQVKMALSLLSQMEYEGMKPNEVTFVSILNGCATIAALEHGRLAHLQVVKHEIDSDIFVGNALVNMYAKCGKLHDAHVIFNRIPEKDGASWNAMISGFAELKHPEEAVKLFWQMEQEGMKPDQVTFACVLKACEGLRSSKLVKQVHSCIIKSEFELDITVASTLVMVYSKSGNIADALEVFYKCSERNVILWNHILAGCIEQGYGEHAVKLYHQMRDEKIPPNMFTFVVALNACATIAALEHGRQIHSHIVKCKLESNIFIGSSVVDMYAKCGSLGEAQKVFDNMPEQDVVLWNTVIAGYVQHGLLEEAVDLFQQIKRDMANLNEVTFVILLNACACLTALELGRQVHVKINETVVDLDVTVGSALIDMYAKSGSIKDACQMFNKIPRRDEVCWNIMVTAYAQHGHSKKSFQVLELMKQQGLRFDHVTFVGILCACGHAGLVNVGYHCFYSMILDHHIMPTMEHYACMVDLLGRAGRLEEADDFIRKMPVEPSAVVWRALLGACRIHHNVELAKYAAEFLLEIEPQSAAAFVVLSNIFNATGG